MAGLTAADAARHAGADVVVLEARDRIGGRTWTAQLGSGSIDLGGAWVHDPVGNPVAEALAAAGIEARNDGPYYSRMAVWSDDWLDAADATALAAAVGADWDPAQRRRHSPTPIDSSTASSGTSPTASSTGGWPSWSGSASSGSWGPW